MHSVVDWFAYARWVNGTLVRSLSLSPDSGVFRLVHEEMHAQPGTQPPGP